MISLFVKPVVWLSVIDKNDFFDLWNIGLSRLALIFQQVAQYYSKRENQMVFVIIRHGIAIILTYMLSK